MKKFQIACNYDVDGVVSAELQQAIYYVLSELKETFGEDSIPAVEMVAEEINFATVEAKANIIIRSQPDTESEELGKVYIGDTVMVLGTDGKWANIVSGKLNGYMYVKYLTNPTVDYNYILRYTGADGKTYSIGSTVEERLKGAKSFADEFSALYAS